MLHWFINSKQFSGCLNPIGSLKTQPAQPCHEHPKPTNNIAPPMENVVSVYRHRCDSRIIHKNNQQKPIHPPLPCKPIFKRNGTLGDLLIRKEAGLKWHNQRSQNTEWEKELLGEYAVSQQSEEHNAIVFTNTGEPVLI